MAFTHAESRPLPGKDQAASTLAHALAEEGVATDKASSSLRRPTYALRGGFGAAPTAFVRSPLFANSDPGKQLFGVLGLKHLKVERGAEPLNETHLLALAYFVSLVETYDEKLGATAAFAPWDAVRTLQWTRSTQSLKRLERAIETLARTTVRIVHEGGADREAAPLVARRVFSSRKHWEVQLTATLLAHLDEFRTYIDFATLQKLPNGAVPLYLFIMSERSIRTEWFLDELAALAGLSSEDEGHVRRKLGAMLRVLVKGEHKVKPRGEAVKKHPLARVVQLRNGETRHQATEEMAVTYWFKPVLVDFGFRRDRHGRWRVELTKAPKEAEKKTLNLNAADGLDE